MLPFPRPSLEGGGLRASLLSVLFGGGEAILQRVKLGLVTFGLGGKSSLEVGAVAGLQSGNLGAQLGEGLGRPFKLRQAAVGQVLDPLQLGRHFGHRDHPAYPGFEILFLL